MPYAADISGGYQLEGRALPVRIVVVGESPHALLAAAVAGSSGAHEVGLVNGSMQSGPARLAFSMGGDRRDLEITVWRAIPSDGVRTHLVLVGEVSAHARILEGSRAALGNATVLLAPGGFGGSLVVGSLLEGWGLGHVPVGEVTGLPALGTVDGQAVTVSAVKHHLPLAAMGDAALEELATVHGSWLDGLERSSVAEAAFANINHVIHPPVVIANAADIDRATPVRVFRDGLTPAVCRLIEAIDRERLLLAATLGIRTVPTGDWLTRLYPELGTGHEDTGTLLRRFVPYENVLGPTKLRDRYLIDDVGRGLGQLAGLADLAGVPIPVIDSVVTIAEILASRPLRASPDDWLIQKIATPASRDPLDGADRRHPISPVESGTASTQEGKPARPADPGGSASQANAIETEAAFVLLPGATRSRTTQRARQVQTTNRHGLLDRLWYQVQRSLRLVARRPRLARSAP
jgi:opine dehydrogenase